MLLLQENGVVKGNTFTTTLALAALALGMLGLLARRAIVSVSRINMSLKEIDLLAGLHRCIRLDLSKESNIR